MPSKIMSKKSFRNCYPKVAKMSYENDLIGFSFFPPNYRWNEKFALSPVWRTEFSKQKKELWPDEEVRKRQWKVIPANETIRQINLYFKKNKKEEFMLKGLRVFNENKKVILNCGEKPLNVDNEQKYVTEEVLLSEGERIVGI
jgi:hypothetical protein